MINPWYNKGRHFELESSLIGQKLRVSNEYHAVARAPEIGGTGVAIYKTAINMR